MLNLNGSGTLLAACATCGLGVCLIFSGHEERGKRSPGPSRNDLGGVAHA
jgi:hypothetical protein